MRLPIRSLAVIAALTLLLLQGVVAQTNVDPRYVRAFGVLFTTAQLGGLVKQWCDARAPLTRDMTNTALAEWKSSHRLDDIEQRAATVLGDRLPSLLAAVQARRESVFRALDQDSRDPEADCRQMLSYLNRSANPRRLHPEEFRMVAGPRAGTASAAAAPVPVPAPKSPGPTGVPPGQARSTVYSVAQLAAFVAQEPRTARARLAQLGSITVQGTLETYDETRPGETVWLNTLADGWRSRMSVLCYDQSFRRLYDAQRRQITVRGTVRQVESWIQLQDCQILANTADMTPSPLSQADGLQRIPVKPEQVRTAPDRGLTMADIEGVYQPSKLRYNPMTLLFESDETTYLVLKDGWLYDQLSVSPHDLNVPESRRLEPQHWHRWRRRGAAIETQTHDQHGRTEGKWSLVEWVPRPPIGPRRLNGVFTAVSSASAGMVGGGGATSISQTSYTFRADGGFSWLNFTQGFASSNSGTGPGGTSIVVGGASVGPGGTAISSVGGGEDEGTYTTQGYTLELRTRSGKVHRFPIFSWDGGKYRNHLVINGTSYAPPK